MKKLTLLLAVLFLFSGMAKAQQKTTMNVKDLDSHIEKYVEKNYKDYKIVEAHKYDAVYEMKLHKENSTEDLVFDSKGKFLYKKTEADKAKVSMQTRSTISLGDVESDITKYLKKNYDGYKLSEAYKYDEVYTTKIVKGSDAETLLFDKEGKFVKKEMPAKAAAPAHKPDSAAKHAEHQKKDSVPPTHENKGEPAKPDTTKK